MRYVFVLVLIAKISFAQPEWVDYQRRTSLYPDEKFLTGFSSQSSKSRTEDELREDAEMAARAELTEKVITKVKSLTVSNITNTNSITETYFKKISSSTSGLTITGLKVENYFDEKRRIAYCFAYAKKNDIIEWYNLEAKKNFELLESKIRLASTQTSMQDALKLYLECFAIFPTLEETYTIITALQKKEPFDVQQIEGKRQEVLSRIKTLSSETVHSLADVAALISTHYKLAISKETAPLIIKPLTYQNTGFASNFSAKLALFFEQKMAEIAGLSLFDGSGKDFWELSGTYWVEGESLRILTRLKEAKTGKLLHANEFIISLNELQYTGSFLPENLQLMLDLKQQIDNHDPSNNLHIRVTTNKGSEGLVYEQGERMTLFVTVNQPSFVRAIYYMADGNRVLLLDNQFIGENYVNRPFRIPQEFECDAPFGGEMLQVIAQTERFTPLITKNINGYHIISESHEEVLAKSRGFKPIGNTGMKGETSLIITTLPKVK